MNTTTTTIDARKETPERVADEVAQVIYGGGTVIFPTDTVYGIGCDPYRPDAIDRIYGAKKRPDNKPLSLHLATVAEFLEYLQGNAMGTLAARRLMPGPVTIIVRRPAFISEDVSSGLATVGFRVPDDPLCSAILERCGPLAATSANTSGQRPYYGAGDAETLPPADLHVENGPTKYGAESSVIDLSSAQPRLLREGVLTLEYLSERLGPVVRQTVKVRNTE
ncbi:MAG TPA: L-threonylcarbamoyladenylate synthase [Candidatus Baltobacteraceae bacterium]|nr:L-threonylcarbamoyladenylate synthase [Candidatus Baltobacteraceae bacterium]